MREPWIELQDPKNFPNLKEAYPSFHANLRRIGELMEKIIVPIQQDRREVPVEDIAVFSLGRLACEDFLEMLVLAENGLGVGAMKLLRGLYERAVTGEYISDNPAEALAFYEYHFIDLQKINKRSREVYGPAWEELAAEQTGGLPEIYEELRPNYKPKRCEVCKIEEPFGWTKVSLPEIAKAVDKEYERAYLGMALLPNAHIHATMAGYFQRFKPNGDHEIYSDKIDQSGFVRAALEQGHAMMELALHTQNKRFNCGQTIGDLWRAESWPKEGEAAPGEKVHGSNTGLRPAKTAQSGPSGESKNQ